jgi:hypothetical protein
MSRSRNETAWALPATVLAAAVFFCAAPARAQVLGLGTWDGAVETTAEVARQDTKTPHAPLTRFDRTHADERLSIRNSSGYLYDPRLLTFSLGGSFGLSQDWLSVNSQRSFDNSKLYGYDASVDVLPGQRLSLSLFASRDESIVSRELAGRGDVLVERQGAVLTASGLYIPSTLSVRRELDDERSESGGLVTRRAERRNILTYQGQRGWTDSELEVNYEFIDSVNEVFSKLSFESHDAQLRYSLDFGEELNWHWDSRVKYTTRTGLIQLTILTVDEGLRIDHTERLHSEYHYFLVRSDQGGVTSTSHTGTASLVHQLFESVTTTGALEGVHLATENGEKDSARGRLTVRYTKRLPGGGRVSLGLGGGLQYEDDRFSTSQTSVVQETHTAAAPLALPIQLANRPVIPGSIVVTKIAEAPRPVFCGPAPALPVVLTADVDFTVRTTGDVTEIVPLPCTGATVGINPGDTIAVDYRVTVSRALTFTTQSWQGDLSVEYPWFRVFVSHEESHQTRIAGRAEVELDQSRSDAVGAELRAELTRLRASLGGEFRHFDSTRTRYDSVRLGAQTDATVLPDLRLSVSGDVVDTTFLDPHRETRVITGRAGATYILGADLLVEAGVSIQELHDTQQASQQSTEAHVRTRWTFRKLEISPAFEYFERRQGGTVGQEYRATLRTIRRF